MATAAAESHPATEHKVKPSKPDEEAYKTELAKLEKEHAVVQEKLVSRIASYSGFVILGSSHCARLK